MPEASQPSTVTVRLSIAVNVLLAVWWSLVWALALLLAQLPRIEPPDGALLAPPIAIVAALGLIGWLLRRPERLAVWITAALVLLSIGMLRLSMALGLLMFVAVFSIGPG